ncbi:MAG: hypothetical protein HN577_13965 [Rhodospirillaceae bacterium]|nr:hypothetical protein [Rhodospirillaceae bacterium]
MTDHDPDERPWSRAVEPFARTFDELDRFLDTLLKVVISDQNAETAAPALSAMLIYILMAAILAFQPQGLFPPKGR